MHAPGPHVARRKIFSLYRTFQQHPHVSLINRGRVLLLLDLCTRAALVLWGAVLLCVHMAAVHSPTGGLCSLLYLAHRLGPVQLSGPGVLHGAGHSGRL